jgi:hypothetical protein
MTNVVDFRSESSVNNKSFSQTNLSLAKWITLLLKDTSEPYSAGLGFSCLSATALRPVFSASCLYAALLALLPFVTWLRYIRRKLK